MGDDLCFVRSERLGQPRGHEYDIDAPDGCVWCALSHEVTALRSRLDEAVRLLRAARFVIPNMPTPFAMIDAFLAAIDKEPDDE